MSLAPGTRLGVYEVIAAIGQGGMGEVYRARDTKLDRDVAIKILPEAFAHDPDRVARFQREAKTLAALNHPNIGGIYGVEEYTAVVSGFSRAGAALVLELVDGPTLADRIARGSLPLHEALPIAKQIAEALAAAHEHGIIHRDLKPANITVRDDGTVKVLDFGLAKALGGDGVAADASLSPTQSVAATRAGVILGTAAYMSPEQARGKQVDKRSDIWAFGCVLFQMLAGRQVFDGQEVTDVLARVLEREPDWRALPANTPPPIRTLLKRCLEKDRRRRIADISTALFVLEDHAAYAAVQGPQGGAGDLKEVAEARLARRRGVVFGAAALLLCAAAAATLVWMATRPTSMPVARLVIPTAGAATLNLSVNDRVLAMTSDGRHLVYRTANQLLVRALDRLEATVLFSGAPRSVFLSPDGQWVGFVDGAGSSPVKKVPITGGPVVTLTTTDGASRGATWGEDDAIVYATSSGSTGLSRVSSAGGASTVLTKPDRGRGEADHLWPEFLPGSPAVLFTITALSGGLDNAQIAVLDLETGAYKTVLRGGHDAHYVPTGHLVYGAGGTLRAVPFDLGRREVTGPPVPIPERVETTAIGNVRMALASTGTLVYVPSRGGVGEQESLVWVDRMGREEPLAAPARAYQYARISPDGTRVALDALDQEQDIWIWDIARKTLTRLTLDPSLDLYAVWTPDSRRIVFASQRAGSQNIYSQAADGTGTLERLTESARSQFPYSMTPNGTALIMREDAPQAGSDLLLLALAPGAKSTPQPLVQSMFAELNAELAPDGRWLAYQSNESGRDEIYVRPFPDVAGGRWQVSTGGGRTPLWARSGRELFYRSPDAAVMAIRVEPGPVWRAGPPTLLLPARYLDETGTTGRKFDLTPDGQRFLMFKQVGASEAALQNLVVVQNWFEELKRLVPTD